MSIVFELYIECFNKVDAEKMASYFSNVTFKLLSGVTASTTVTEQPSESGAFGVVVFPNVGGLRGIRTLQDALDCTEAGLRLYKYLQGGPDFDFAHVGLEAENISMAGLQDYLHPLVIAEGEIVWMDFQCVVNDRLYEKLGRPKYFHQFRPGYMWNRYYGEKYSPLFSNDQGDLNSLCQQLLPEFFDSRLWR